MMQTHFHWKNYFLSIGIIAIAYLGTGEFILSNPTFSGQVSPVWPSAGIAMAGVILFGLQSWPGVALGSFLLDFTHGASLFTALGGAAGSVSQVLVGVMVLQWAQVHKTLDRLRDVVRFIGIAVLLAPIVNATWSTVTLILTDHLGDGAWKIWSTFWLGDGMGILMIAPPILLMNRAWFMPKPPLREWIEIGLWLCLLAAMSGLIFYGALPSALVSYPVEYLPFPLLVWATLRYGPLPSVMGSSVVSVIATAGAAQGVGPFITRATLTGHSPIWLLQAFMAVIASTTLLLAIAIRQQRITQHLLQCNEEKFAKAFGFSPDAITISTLNEGRLIDVNDSFLELTGYTREEVINLTVEELGLWVNQGERQRLVDQLRQHRCIRNEEFEFHTCSGTSRFALVSAELIPMRGETYILLVARDITEQKRAHERLRLSMERDRLLGMVALHIRQTLDLQGILDTTVHEVRQLLQASRVFISRFDTTGKGRVVSESVLPDCASLMGECTDKGVYQDIWRVFKDMPVVAINDMENLSDFPCLSFLEECVQRYQVKAALGVPIIVNDALYGILVAHCCDRPRFWQTFERELLEQLATQVAIAIQQGELYARVQELNAGLEHQVAERTQQLEQKMAELQELHQLSNVFLHTVSHDLRTTVMGNLMILRNLQSQPNDPVQIQHSFLERMIQAGECQLNKLNSLQEAYQLKTEGLELALEPIQLKPLIQSIITNLAPLIEKNHATITVFAPDTLPSLSADKTLIQRTFTHLISNALIHNPPRVTIRVTLDIKQGNLLGTIADDGIGIPKEVCDRLFNLSIGTPDNPQLTGISLGLYFCYQVIDAHGGTISVSSTPHKGTTFTVTLPVTPNTVISRNAYSAVQVH